MLRIKKAFNLSISACFLIIATLLMGCSDNSDSKLSSNDQNNLKPTLTTVKLSTSNFLSSSGVQDNSNPQSSTGNSYSQLTSIRGNQALTQPENDYYVYYYMVNCPFCKQIENEFFEFAKKRQVYIVDIKIKENRTVTYDLKKHREKYDKEIGKTDNYGNIIFYDGESREKYENSTETNQYGKKIKYEIVVADESYVKTNKNARIGYVYASNVTPAIDYSNVSRSEDLVIAGSPTLLHIVNGRVANDYFDSTEISEFFETVEKFNVNKNI